MKTNLSLKLFTVVLLGFLTFSGYSQYNRQSLTQLSNEFGKKSFDELLAFYSIPNDANYRKDIEKNIAWCEKSFTKRGFKTEKINADIYPLLLASLDSGDKNAKTILIYLQIDGQPVDPTKWNQEHPFKPVVKEKINDTWKTIPNSSLKTRFDEEMRIFVRSASDAKGPVMMFLAAMDALKSKGDTPPFNIKVIMDFEEELSSPHLPDAVERYKKKLKSDYLIIFDGPRHISNKPTLTFGARGIATITLTVFGPKVPQHSGHYGNYAPNPAFRLSQLLSGMKDENGRVTLPGFYDGITLNKETRKILALVPDDESEIKRKIGIHSIDNVGSNYQEAIQYPSLNIRGMSSGWVREKSRTIIPSEAIAEIDVRLVKESNAKVLINKVKNYVESKGYHFIKGDTPTEEERLKYPKICAFNYQFTYDAYRTDMESPLGKWLNRALYRAFDSDPIKIRTSGGSIPISPFVNKLGIPAVTVPTVNRDNNQHSPNENIRMGNYIEGVRTILSILTEKP